MMVARGVVGMGGCEAAMQAGWPALCQVVQFAGQAQAIASRVTGTAAAATSAGPLPLLVLLLLAMVGMVVAWQVFLFLAERLFAVYPYVLAFGVAWLLFVH